MKTILPILTFLCITSFSLAAQFYIPNGDVTSLKSAINISNTNGSPDTIHLFPYGQYLLNTVDNNFVLGNNALPRIILDQNFNNTLTILGNGAQLILDTTKLKDVRIFYIDDGKISVNDLGFINGSADIYNNPGGAILMNGSSASTHVDFINCLFKGNTAFQGGALYVSNGNVNIINCTFTNNSALFLGGAITNLYGSIVIMNSMMVNNTCTNTSGPGAIYNYLQLNSPQFYNVSLYGSIVAKNTYQHPSAPNDGQEYDLTKNAGIYTLGSNFIGAYDSTAPAQPQPFAPGLPCANNDYVGTSSKVIDPLLGTFSKHTDYQKTYGLLPGSLALKNQAGNSFNNNPDIASYGLFPTSGSFGDMITIYGKNLSTIFKVQFEGASVTSGFTVTDTTITIPVPAAASTGHITVYNYNYIPATSAQTFTVNLVTGLNPENKNTALSVYPNPASDDLIVNTGGNKYVITDLYGQELSTSALEKINISALPEGIYLIKCGNEVRKFIKE